MNRLIGFVLLFLMLASCGDGQKSKVISSYDNGQPAKVRYYDKGGQCIREVEYHEDGKLYMEGGIKNNLRDGEWTSYFPDGKVQSKGYYENGIRLGKALVYYENGNLWMEGLYSNDKMCGEWIIYDEQGYEIGRPFYGECD